MDYIQKVKSMHYAVEEFFTQMTLLTLELFSGGNEEMCPRSLVEKYTMPYVLVRLRLPEELLCLSRDVLPVPAAHPLHQSL